MSEARNIVCQVCGGIKAKSFDATFWAQSYASTASPRLCIGHPESTPTFIDRQDIRSALKRLSRNYAERTGETLKKARACIDADSMARSAILAAHWEAKQDGVHAVADALGIVLGEDES